MIVAPPGQAEPGGQGVQTLFWVVVQGTVSYVPGKQTVQLLHELWFANEKVEPVTQGAMAAPPGHADPAGQAEHSLS